MKIGIISLLESAKATLALLVLTCSTIGLLTSHIDGTSYAIVMGTVSAIFFYVHGQNDRASMGQSK